jgi:hypothetical protein
MNTLQNRDPAVALSGDWEFRPDPEDVGKSGRWYERGRSWDTSETVSVPHSWQEQPDLREYTGVGWYRTRFSFEVHSGRTHLVFGAVDYETTIWVNGQQVGHNTGGYLPFHVDVTDAIEEGKNTVVLRVYDPEDMSDIPHGKQGDPWYTRVSGPWQSVDLVRVPATHITSARVTPDLSDDSARFETAVAGDREELSVEISVRQDGSPVANARAELADGTATVSLDIADADYWSPEDPVLYDFEVTLRDGDTVVDTYEDYFGMRSIDYEGGQLYLNGEPFFMRGALDQAYYPRSFYRPQDLETFEREIETAKELGFNLLRKHIKPAHPAFLEAADRLGILVWEEPANPSVYTDGSKRRVREQLHGMVERDYNHPSVVIWSVYNEEWGIGAAEETSLWEDAEKQDYLEEVYHETKSADPTRLVCDNSGWAHVATDVNDYHEYYVAPDRLEPWRERLTDIAEDPGDNYGEARTDPTEAPIVVSEFGTWGLPDVDALLDYYGAEPHWFSHEFLDGMKRPSGVREKFAESPASAVFDSLKEFAAAWQKREFESVEPMIADMREHDAVSGYCITEFSDIEWEFNGVLDYRRERKAFHDDFARVNAPVFVYLDVDAHSVWSGETVTADVVVVNDTGDSLAMTATVDAMDTTDRLDIDVGPYNSRRIADAVSVPAPSVDGVEARSITVSVDDRHRTHSQDVFVVENERIVPESTIYVEPSRMREAFTDRGYSVTDDPSDAELAVTTDPDATDVDTVLVVPDENGEPVETPTLDYTELSQRESWNLCAGLVYQNLFAEVDQVPGRAFEGIYPYGYLSDVDESDTVVAGYTEGWIANSGGAITQRNADGRELCVCTLRVTDSYGDNPMATATLDRLVDTLV